MIAEAISALPPQGNPHFGYKTFNYNVKGQSASLTHKTYGSNCCNQCELEEYGRKNCPRL